MTPHSPNHSLRSGPHRRQNPIAGLPGSIRRGSVLTLMAFMLPVLIILSAFAINIAHMQVSRAELIVATDAAARAAGRSFSEHQSVDEARSYAHVTAAQHHVDGSRLEIDPEQLSYLEFGQTSQPDGPDGRFIFHPVPTAQVVSGAVFASAVRVHGRRNDGSITGRIPLLFPAFMAIEDYEMVTSAVALQVDRDISLVVDRSGSMSDTSFAFPSGSNPFSWDNLWEGVDAGVLERRNGSFYYADGVTPYDYKAWAWEELFELGTP
ncbi:MAG: pilus assembly protein TadG-related protein, partial [Planctomycetota bacterium]